MFCGTTGEPWLVSWSISHDLDDQGSTTVVVSSKTVLDVRLL